MRILALALTLAATQGAAQSATVSGTDGQNALGTVPCAALVDQPIADCPAELRRKYDGGATLAVQLPTGEVRRIYFENGEPTSSSSTSPMSHEVSGNLMVIFIEPNEVFEVPANAVKPQ
ncbi:hypothetical protein Q5Y75_25250 [Ruegeria sp. 2205SS24-7]|uniref:hypothetical protein n=1 Tax=Ruegeria discodermiae TaxID=3064389 RepID=UPI0027418B84|nr:hypothetical protein [Ruegeria sp. 2205SS24-7]MDP5220498.1 hypothetical protein [Ruegeria sp. 2205SS24-7]